MQEPTSNPVMSVEELLARVQRIYAAVEAIQEFDMTKLPAKVRTDQDRISFPQDFTAGLSQAQIENFAYTLVHNIANFGDHLRGWACRNGRDPGKIDEAIRAADSIKIIKDLSNNDKHGYPPRDGGSSRKAPKVVGIRRLMRLQTGNATGSGVAMTLGPGGVPKVISHGDGSGRALITGEVVDKDNNRIGDLYDIELKAVLAWEKLLTSLEVRLDPT